MSTALERATFPDLRREQCIALTTFRYESLMWYQFY